MKKILLVLVMLLLVTGCKDKNNNTNIEPNNNTEVKETVRYYYFENVTQTDPEDPSKTGIDKQQLYLLNDGTYWYVSGIDCREAAYGTYTEDDNNVTLNEQRTYGCRGCYYEMEFSMTFEKNGQNLEYSGIKFELQNEEVDMSLVRRTSDKNCASEN